MKRIGFLSFGHWTPSPQSQNQSAADALQQSIDLAVEAERLGMDGAYFRVHHFARQLASPFPLLAAVGAKTRRIEIGTAVIDMRYGHPHYMAEDAGAADLIAGGRLQLGIRSRFSRAGDRWLAIARLSARMMQAWDDGTPRNFSSCYAGRASRGPTRVRCFPIRRGFCALSRTPKDCVIGSGGGSASNATAAWAAKLGMNLQTSTLKFDETGEPPHIQQAAQIRSFRAAWKEAGHARTPRISVSRSIFALIDNRDRAISDAAVRKRTK
jgi:alkanesulfonate monooxygenase SsuD/methylene tetrahydromethanopterin reductase-like flavin-dependent oxidoreductase (luciferase family)